MSVLAPLFLLGGLAVALPIIFHLIRRQPRGSVPFSSLMFLEASPPRLTRQSRIDNWLLLLLRGLALLLIAAAFTRPFLRSEATAEDGSVGRFVVVLIDRSASMRRGDLWEQAVEAALRHAETFGPTDRVAWGVFDAEVEVLRDFDAGTSGSQSEVEMVRAALRGTSPTWRHSDLGRALTTAADSLDDATRQLDAAGVDRTVVLISDMQAGSELSALRGYQWPDSTRVHIEQVAVEPSSNATIILAAPISGPSASVPDGHRSADQFRVSVSNDAESERGQFSMRWIDSKGEPLGTPAISVTVPPGTMRTSPVAAPPAGAVAIELVGDDHSFDNRRFVALPRPIEQTILYVGEDPDDPRESLVYYLQRIDFDRPGRTVTVRTHPPTEPLRSDASAPPPTPQRIPLVVLATAPGEPLRADLARYLDEGGRVLIVVDAAAAEEESIEQAAQTLSGDPSLRFSTTEVDDYVLMTHIDFAHPLFEPFADPRYSDFTKIQFWAHQRVTFDESDHWRTVARFGDRDPALLQRDLGQGRLWVLAAGWQPTESQLALSSKFVPILAGMARDADRQELSPAAVIGEAWDLPVDEAMRITAPDGGFLEYRTAADAQFFDTPGIYRYRDGETERTVAVNLAATESRTEPMDRSVLEQLGVRFTDQQQAEQRARVARQLRDVEIEKRQQWWRVLLLAGLAMIGVETMLSSRGGSARARGTTAGRTLTQEAS